jgi:putative hydrolase of the HAD superfamily
MLRRFRLSKSDNCPADLPLVAANPAGASVNVLVWDFDGTLGYCDGRWTGTLADILARSGFNLSVDAHEKIARRLRTGFPWHAPATEHSHIRSADAWWSAMQPLFENAFRDAGVAPEPAKRFAREVRARYCASDRWHLFDDAATALHDLCSLGWRHVLLSNHVPELPRIVERLGLAGAFDRIVTSADTGYEKPHPLAFAAAIAGLKGVRNRWMIGDSLEADFAGAMRAGWPAILVRTQAPVTPRFDTLAGVVAFLRNVR